jgi:hypothetical protein
MRTIATLFFVCAAAGFGSGHARAQRGTAAAKLTIEGEWRIVGSAGQSADGIIAFGPARFTQLVYLNKPADRTRESYEVHAGTYKVAATETVADGTRQSLTFDIDHHLHVSPANDIKNPDVKHYFSLQTHSGRATVDARGATASLSVADRSYRLERIAR